MSTISVGDAIVDEASRFAIFEVRLDVPDTSTVTVDYSTAWQGSAFPGDDYTNNIGTVTFEPGNTQAFIIVPIINDTTVETLESFALVLSNPSVNATIVDDYGLGIIVDNDAPVGTPVVSITDTVVDEADGLARFVITLSKPSTSTVSMTVATQNGTAVAGSDFVGGSLTVTFAPGEMTRTIDVSLVNDAVVEGSEAFNLVLSGVTNATAPDLIGTATIWENDAPQVTTSNIFVDDVIVDESQLFADFIVRLDVPNTQVVTVRYDTFTYSASPGSDYHNPFEILTFVPGETEKTVRIPLINDTTSETLEHFYLKLTDPSFNAVIADGIAFGTIVDNDAPVGTPVVSIADVVVNEADKTATFVITLNKPSTSVVSMTYATQNGTALAGSDFVAASGALAFAQGEMVKTVKVALLNDTALEASEAFNLVLSGVTNATAPDPIGTATIWENDAPQVATSHISVDDVIVDEAQGFADFLVRLDVPNTEVVTVDYQSINLFSYDANLTAAWGADFTPLSEALTFLPGETVKTVHIPVFNDGTLERPESFYLTLFNPSVNTTITKSMAIATIAGNDQAAGTPAARLSDAVVDEANKVVTATVTLDRPSTGTVSFTIAGQDGTATANSDYRALTALGKIAFAPGETAKTVTFGLLNDTTSESAEVFDVVLSSPVGATIADGRAHIIIPQNDGATVAVPVITVADVATTENTGYLDFVVTLSAPSTSPVSVNLNALNGTAIPYYDYDGPLGLLGVGTLVFAPGEVTKSVRFSIFDDAIPEPQETFTLNLSSATNATIGNASATATIIDNESPAPVAPIAFAGTTGNDILRGTQFADAMTGGNGNDILDGGAGNDNYTGGAGNDTYFLEETGDTYTEAPGGGTDLVISYLNTHTLGGEVENLTLAGSAVTGIGNSGNNTIIGNASNNTIEGGLGNDTLNGGAGTDTVSYSSATAGVTVNLGLTTPQNTVSAGTDTLSNLENIRGSNFNDNLTGNGGTNVLTGGAGNDVLNGDAGSDTASYETAAAGVTVSLAIAGAQNTVGAGTDTLSNFENLRGSNFDDTLTGNAASNVIIGHLGNDVLDGGAGTDTASYETSTVGVTVSLALAGAQNTIGAGTDTLSNFEHLRGGVANDTLTGNGGSNILTGGLGNDVLDGGAGTDTASYDTAFGGVTVNLGLAGSQNTVNAGTDTLSNFENLKGSIHNDTLTGNGANNVIIGDLGNDVLNGDAGIDVVSYETAKVGVTVSLAIAAAQNTVGAGTDTLSNFEQLRGSNYNDTLTGNTGANSLFGGLGNDTMTGGSGQDSFVFNTALNGTTNIDTITDFTPVDDTLVLENAIFTKFTATGAIPAGTFVSGAGAVAADANDYLVYNTTTGTLSFDADGNGAGVAVAFVTLVGIPALTAADFTII